MDPLALLGRFHPMVVHFPIALLVTAVALLAWQRLRDERFGRAVYMLVQLAAVSAVVAAGLGLAYAEAEGFRGSEKEHLDIHKWLTIAGSVLAIVTAVLYRLWPDGRNDVIKVVVLCAATALVGSGAHFGGTLVHGDLFPASEDEGDADASDPTDASARDPEPAAAPPAAAAPDDAGGAEEAGAPETALPVEAAAPPESPEPVAEPKAEPKKPAPKKPAPTKPPADAKKRTVDFKKDVWPIFEKSCFKCHGKKKKKGGLRLDKKKFAMKGGENGKVIVPGKANKSALYKLTTLGEDDEDVMPSKGDLLTKEQQDILKRWINEGAHWPE